MSANSPPDSPEGSQGQPDEVEATLVDEKDLQAGSTCSDAMGSDATQRKVTRNAAGFDELKSQSQEPETECIDPEKTLVQTDLAVAAYQPRYFGEYELLEEIARGGMGVVYKARQTKLNRIVALKMILSGQLASQEEIQRFYIEAEAAANLEHPGIVPIYEIGEHAGQHFFSMGFIDGKSLADRIKEGPLPQREAADITRKIADAIAYAHENNVIHRDLKPANILIDAGGQPKVTDFGLAKKTEGLDGLTSTGQILGTPSYMPPEQAAGDTGSIGPRADVYSIGAILYAILTGRAPFATASVMDTLVQVIEQDPVPPLRLNAAIHPDLETICLKCLSKSQEHRYQMAADLAQELDRFLKGEPIHARASTLLSRTWSTMLSDTRHTEVMAMWSQVWMWHALLVFVLFSVTNVLQWNDSSPVVVVALWTLGLLSICLVIWHCRFRQQVPLTSIERQIGQVWAMFAVAALLTGVINHLMQLATLQLLPLVVLECGLAFGCMAAILGGSFYPIGIACFAVAVLMPVVPAFGPAIFGALFAIGLLVPAVKYSPHGQES